MAQSKSQPNTIEITNFGGRLTRTKNGDINSGFSKFDTSFGYDPFSKPGQLTWLETPTDISVQSPTANSITDLIVAAKPRFESGSTLYIYALGSSKRLYKIQPNSIASPNLDTASFLGTLANGSTQFGASMEFFGATEKIYLGLDDRVTSVNFDGSGEATVGSAANYTSNRYRPLSNFIGKLIFGNGNNIGAIDSTGTVISSIVSSHYEQLSPGFPAETNLTDIDTSPDGNYLYMTTTGTSNENITTVSSDRQAAASSDGNIFYWNGIDQAVTASKSIPSYAVTALQVYLDNNYFFSNDSFGASMSNGSMKVVTLSNNKSPFANSTLVNGNFICWIAPEITASGTAMTASMYYYGQLDEQSEPGLFRVLRYTSTLSNGFVYQTPVNLMVNNRYMTVNNAVNAITTLGYGKHYISTFEVNAANSTVSSTTAHLYRFLITPTGTGTPQLGVYETQNQLFSKKITIKQIRVYTEPTVTGNGFQIDVIGNNGAVLTNGTFNYSFAAGTDVSLLQGALDRINFNPAMGDQYSIGIRVTNTGTTNMTINKIEIDPEDSGK